MLLDAFLGLTVGAGFLYFINFFYQCLFSKKGIGSGDISLLGILGYFLGVDSLLPTLFYSSLGGLFIGLGFLIKYKKPAPTVNPRKASKSIVVSKNKQRD